MIGFINAFHLREILPKIIVFIVSGHCQKERLMLFEHAICFNTYEGGLMVICAGNGNSQVQIPTAAIVFNFQQCACERHGLIFHLLNYWVK